MEGAVPATPSRLAAGLLVVAMNVRLCCCELRDKDLDHLGAVRGIDWHVHAGATLLLTAEAA